jgi:hypothetical protein
VVPREGAQWWVEAGPYTVAVKGTVFDVAWEPTDQVFELVMIRGQVEVRGPAASSGGISLQAGQRLTARPREARIVVDDGDVTPGATTRLPPAAPSVVPAAAAPTPRETPPVPAHDRRQVEPTNWDKLVAAGNFSAVLTAAEHAGVATVLARAPATDLVALADAARYERRADLAERTLLALRRRFASAPEAAEAAFLLGRLVESGTPADALSWYDHYLAEAPSGPYLAEALGRKMSLVRRQQGDEAARPIARSYLERFPTGAHASLARTLVGGP